MTNKKCEHFLGSLPIDYEPAHDIYDDEDPYAFPKRTWDDAVFFTYCPKCGIKLNIIMIEHKLHGNEMSFIPRHVDI